MLAKVYEPKNILRGTEDPRTSLTLTSSQRSARAKMKSSWGVECRQNFCYWW